MAERDEEPKLTVLRPDQEQFRRAEGFDGLYWNAHQTLREDVRSHAETIADHGGQLKTIPALAAAIHQNFGLWFAVISLVVATVVAGFAFLGAYQVSNSQTLDEHTVQLTNQSAAIARIEQDVREVGSTARVISEKVDALRLDERSARTPARDR